MPIPHAAALADLDPFVAPALLVLLYGPLVAARRLRARRRFERDNEQAMAAFNQGAFARAAEMFDTMVLRYRRQPFLHHWARYNAGSTWLHAGDLERACVRLTPVAQKTVAPWSGMAWA